MDGHIWRWAGIIPPGFEPEFELRLAHYSKCYTYTWFGSALPVAAAATWHPAQPMPEVEYRLEETAVIVVFAVDNML